MGSHTYMAVMSMTIDILHVANCVLSSGLISRKGVGHHAESFGRKTTCWKRYIMISKSVNYKANMHYTIVILKPDRIEN